MYISVSIKSIFATRGKVDSKAGSIADSSPQFELKQIVNDLNLSRELSHGVNSKLIN